MTAFEVDDDEEVEGYTSADLNVLDRTCGKPRLLSERCETCIFHAGNRMKLHEGRVKGMVEDALNAGGFIVCHKTLPGSMNPEKVQAAVCRGFYEGFGPRSNVLRIYDRLGGFIEVDPPAKF